MNALWNYPSVRRLLTLQREGPTPVPESESKWREKAIKTLVKKLRHSGELDDFEKAIRNKDKFSRCVCMPRLGDGRWQISQKKGLPHVIFCRIFRYPDLIGHQQLRSVDTCLSGYNPKRSDICINPYHYEKINIDLPAVMVPRHTGEALPPHPVIPSFNPYGQPYSFSGIGSPTTPPSDFTVSEPHSPVSPTSTISSKPFSPQSVIPDELLDVELGPEENCPPSAAALRVLDSFGERSGDFVHMEVYSPASEDDGMQAIACPEPNFWCSISYYELSARVGDTFHASLPTVTIDGGTDPSSAERICLGLLANVNRNPVVETARRYIGRGVRLVHAHPEIYVECIGESSVFIQSPLCNRRHGWHDGTVCKIPSGCRLSVFNSEDFAALLAETIPNGFEAVYNLTKVCTLRMSLVKGWGAEYRRQTITAVPCWVEIYINGPLQWLDKVLVQMGSPQIPCTSFS